MVSPVQTVVISLDAELAWGFNDWESIPRERVEHGRRLWPRLVESFEHHDVPATWAIVGHLMLDECDGKHADHPLGPDWFVHDPGSTSTDEPLWFGRDLVELVTASSVPHDIGSHSFSHVEYGTPGTSRAVAVAETERAVDLADRWGVDLDSFVFPRNSIGHRAVLAEHGFTCYRGLPQSRRESQVTSSSVRKLRKLGRVGFGATPPVVEPSVDDYGLVDIPSSLHLFSFEGIARSLVRPISRAPVCDQVRAGLESLATGREGVLHLWFHPNNVVSESDLRRVDDILELVATYRESTDVEVATMRDVARRCV